jgi:hypothetical protein
MANSSTKRTISSGAFSAFKMLVLCFAVIFVTSTISWSFDAGRFLWRLLVVPGAVVLFFVLLIISRKTVQMDDRNLYVSVFRRVTTIPLSQIAAVSEKIGLRDRVVTVRFRGDTPVGNSIQFSPTFRLTRDPHPIVKELQRFADVPHQAI